MNLRNSTLALVLLVALASLLAVPQEAAAQSTVGGNPAPPIGPGGGGGSFIPSAPPWINVPASSSTGTYPISWGAVSNATSYDLEEATDANFVSTQQIYSGSQQSFQVTGRTSGTYWYRVRASNSLGASKWTAGANPCQVQLTPPAPPATITVPATDRDGIYTVSWDYSTGATFYDLEEDTDPGFSNPLKFHGLATVSYNVTGKTDGTYHYRVRAGNSVGTSVWTVGSQGCVVTLEGTLTLAAGAGNFTGTEIPGAVDVPVLQIDLSFDFIETITVTAVTVTEGGTIDLATAVNGAKLHRDVNGDGLLDAGDVLIAAASAPTGNTFRFTGLSESFSASTSGTWLVTYDISSSAPLGATILVSVASDADVTVTGSITPVPFVTGAPVDGSLKAIGEVGSLSILQDPEPAGGVLAPGAEAVSLLHVRFAAGSKEPVKVLSFTVSASGSGNDAADITGVFLYYDVDGNGVFDRHADLLQVGPELFPTDDGTVNFPVNRSVPAGGAEGFFVVCNVSPSAAVGSTFTLAVKENADVAAEGVDTRLPVPVSGAPCQGGEFTVSAPAEMTPFMGCAAGAIPGGLPALFSLILLFGIALLSTSGAKRFLGR
ncbi:MAG: phage tail protein [Planctomycetota bacterium]|jgi:hypothetical protein